jgi:TetR/AcrR family transcriptional repressor of mexJK operon
MVVEQQRPATRATLDWTPQPAVTHHPPRQDFPQQDPPNDMNHARKVGRPTADAAAELTQRIVEVAMRVFLDKGYAKAGMEEISATSGVAKRSLYSRFPNKSVLFCHVMKSYADQAFEGLDGHCAAELPLEQQLRTACLQVLRALLKPDVATMERVITGEAVRFPELAQSLVFVRNRFLEHIAEILDRSALCKDLRRERSLCAAGFLLDMVISPEIHRAALALVPCEVTEETERRVAQGVALFLHGFIHTRCEPPGP